MADINVNIGSSLVNFYFRDGEGNVISSFRMNPADIKLASRCAEMAESIGSMGSSIPEDAGIQDLLRLNDELEEKICYVLGYDARKSLFGFVSATSIMEDGELFVHLVMNTITEAVKPAVEKRKKAMEAAAARYAAQYQ